MRRKTSTRLRPPFLRTFEIAQEEITSHSDYPFSIPAIASGKCSIEFHKKVTIIVGDNGVGKSTILEAIAAWCWFNLTGGTRNHVNFSKETEILSRIARMAWLPKISDGFFLRAESFFSFINSLDLLAEETGSGIYAWYGWKSLNERSHGESFLALFENRFGHQGIYILDEPEAALSPQRQIDFLRLVRRMDEGDNCQIIMATHSVMLMAYPGAQLLQITHQGVKEIQFHETPHFKTLQSFFRDPDGFMESVFME